MKIEKVIRISLPNGAKYQRVEVTAEETIDTGKESKTVSKALPKPVALIGGTEVYQKEGLPYWFCRIKDGRDEFMHIYFGDLSTDDILYTADGKKRKFVTKEQKEFRVNVMKAMKNMPSERYRWIPVYGPSMDDKGKLQFVLSGANVIKVCDYDWEKIYKNYSPENKSRMDSITTYFLLLLRLLKDGHVTVEQLADDSAEIGHYGYNLKAKHEFEKKVERHLGGLHIFADNTSKIVKDPESSSGFSVIGDMFSYMGVKFVFPLADVFHDKYPCETARNVEGILGLI